MYLRSRHLLNWGYNFSALRSNLYSSLKILKSNSDQDIDISENCVQKLKQLCVNSDNFLRICVESGGCSGFQYKFDLDDKMAKDDRFV